MIEASGPISQAIENLRTLLSTLPSWQAWNGITTGTSDEKAAAALAKTYPIEVQPPAAGERRAYEAAELIALRPFAVVDITEAGAFRLKKYAESSFTESGELLLMFEENVPEELIGDPAGAKMSFTNHVGAVLQELADYSGINGGLNITDISTMAGPSRSDVINAGTQGDFFGVLVVVRYGV